MPVIEFSEDDIWTPERRAVAQDQIESLKHYGRHLTQWQREFLDSIEQQLADHGFLTSNQQCVLDTLYQEKLF